MNVATAAATAAASRRRRAPAVNERASHDMVWIPGGTFTMGSDWHYPEEAPSHRVTVDGFWIDRFPITNEEFARFIHDTNYVTSAERPVNPDDYPGANPDMLAPASVVFRKPPSAADMSNHYNWWVYVPGACWRHPGGPGTDLKDRMNHPVVHVAYEDVLAFLAWAGKDLPTEAEWEFAARGGLDGAEYAWGAELMPRGRAMANTWHGDFPHQNIAINGYEGTSPVGAFPANGYGLHDMIGNVWEWTADWYSAAHAAAPSCCEGAASVNPKGGARDASFDPRDPVKVFRKVMKGGSFLCAPNYCRRYRPAARMAQAIDTATCHLGFRCIVRNAETPETAKSWKTS